MKTQDIKEFLHYNIMVCIRAQNNPEKYNQIDYNYEFIEYMLNHFRDYIFEHGIRNFKEYLKVFDYKTLQYDSCYFYLLTYRQENVIKEIIKTIKEIITK